MNQKVVLAYRSSWNVADLPPGRVAYKPLTHIAHSFAVAETPMLVFPDDKQSRDLVQTAHKNGVKVTLAVGGADSNAMLNTLCGTEKMTVALAKTVAAHVKRIGYDGVDVDWEHPGNAAEMNRLSSFVAALRRELRRPLLLTMAVPSTDWNGRWYDISAIVPHLDWVAVMTYDFYGPWSADAGHHAALFAAPGTEPTFCASAGMAYWEKKRRVPVAKLLMGLPIYARGFRTKNWGDAVPNPDDKKMDAAYRALPPPGTTDTKLVCATWTQESGAVILSGDNAATAEIKGRFAAKSGYAGIFFWELSQDGDGKKTPSLIAAAARGFSK